MENVENTNESKLIIKELETILDEKGNDSVEVLPNGKIHVKDKLAFAPVVLNENETDTKAIKDQLAIDQELQRRVKNSEDVYESEISKLKNYGLKFELKGADPVGINGCIFNPYTTYTIGSRIVSPDGIFLITDDIMNCALTIDSNAMRNERKIKEAGGGTMEIMEHGDVTVHTTRT